MRFREERTRWKEETDTDGDRSLLSMKTYTGRHTVLRTERPISGKGSFEAGGWASTSQLEQELYNLASLGEAPPLRSQSM